VPLINIITPNIVILSRPIYAIVYTHTHTRTTTAITMTKNNNDIKNEQKNKTRIRPREMQNYCFVIYHTYKRKWTQSPANYEKLSHENVPTHIQNTTLALFCLSGVENRLSTPVVHRPLYYTCPTILYLIIIIMIIIVDK